MKCNFSINPMVRDCILKVNNYNLNKSKDLLTVKMPKRYKPDDVMHLQGTKGSSGWKIDLPDPGTKIIIFEEEVVGGPGKYIKSSCFLDSITMLCIEKGLWKVTLLIGQVELT